MFISLLGINIYNYRDREIYICTIFKQKPPYWWWAGGSYRKTVHMWNLSVRMWSPWSGGCGLVLKTYGLYIFSHICMS